MARGTMKRYLSMCLVVVMLLTTLLPVGVYAADDSAIEDTATNYEEPVASELEDVSIELEDQKTEQADDTSADTEISDYATFLSCFKVLEGYAQTYAEENAGENVNALIINYIRTGVERYTSGTWEMVCGKENTAFTAYVSEQDTANNTSASALKNLGNFTLPNGNKVDLGHVFGAMDVANYAKVQGMTDAAVQARADMGSWAGDIADMMFCAENVDIPEKVDTTETDVDILAANIRTKYLGVDYGTLNSVDHSFTDTDLYGDMDAFYLTTEMNRGGVALSTIIENYFTAGLTDASRASYFLTNRLGGMVTKDGIRSKVLSTYTGNTLIGALESSYSLTDLSNYETLRKACCYAFADYLFDLAGDPNGTDPVDPDPDPEPDPEPGDAYYSVFSSDTTTVAPGVTQTINYALTKDDKQIVYYIATADIAREDVSVHANYHANDPSQGWAMSRVSDQMSAAQKRHSDPSDTANYVEHYNAVVGVNADFYNMTTGAPSGALVMEAARRKGVSLLPVDSEHSAIFQCLQDKESAPSLTKILLTASGGPFFGMKTEELRGKTRADALKHPNWNMGAKITIDSATLMNKGLELIEAVWLFGLPPEKIQIVVQRQSIVHSAVQFSDNSIIAQLGVPDMRIPIQYALTYPKRVPGVVPELDFTTLKLLTFDVADEETFRCLAACKKAIRKGGLGPCAANGANEEAVKLFLEDKIGFLDIGRLVEAVVDSDSFGGDYTLADVYECDRMARAFVQAHL